MGLLSSPYVSRREFCIAGVGSAFLPIACGAGSAGKLGYRSTLASGYTPSIVKWAGRKWRCNMGSTWRENMDHCLQLSLNKARFEIRNTPFDRSKTDPPNKLRSEISGSLRGDNTRLPNGQALWGAMSFVHYSWSDAAGMARLNGGVHGQVHIGRTFGGSPALAFRRTKHGEFAVTTRGEFEPKSAVRLVRHVTFDDRHDLVYRLVLHETGGSVMVWLDGESIIELDGVSIGTHHADSYWNVGCYYAGGAICPVIAEYANHVYPGAADLRRRIGAPPVWPQT